jgi:hypothetical protein
MTDALSDLPPQLGQWRDNAHATVEKLAELRRRAEESSKHLESPQAVLEFIDFFSGFFTEAGAILERIRSELEAGVLSAHVEALRQVASNAAVEQRRCLKFRDKWINRPLPYEDVRPLLTEISTHTSRRLTDFRDLNTAAEQLDEIAAPAPPAEDGRPLDRRELFTKWFGR